MDTCLLKPLDSRAYVPCAGALSYDIHQYTADHKHCDFAVYFFTPYPILLLRDFFVASALHLFPLNIDSQSTY